MRSQASASQCTTSRPPPPVPCNLGISFTPHNHGGDHTTHAAVQQRPHAASQNEDGRGMGPQVRPGISRALHRQAGDACWHGLSPRNNRKDSQVTAKAYSARTAPPPYPHPQVRASSRPPRAAPTLNARKPPKIEKISCQAATQKHGHSENAAGTRQGTPGEGMPQGT